MRTAERDAWLAGDTEAAFLQNTLERAMKLKSEMDKFIVHTLREEFEGLIRHINQADQQCSILERPVQPVQQLSFLLLDRRRDPIMVYIGNALTQEADLRKVRCNLANRYTPLNYCRIPVSYAS